MMPITVRFRRVLLALAAAGLVAVPALAAEPTAPAKTPPKKSAPAKKTGPAKAATPAKPAQAANEPAGGLDAVTLYQYMLAEIAAGRGELGVASQAYMELARRLKNPIIARRATELAVQARQGLWALEAAQIWVAAEPDSVPALQHLAVLQLSSGGAPAEAEPALARLLAMNPEARSTMLLQLPRMYASVNDKAQVVASVVRLTEPYATQPEAQLARSQAYLAAGQRSEAERAAREALTLRPGWERAALQIAQSLPGDRENAAMEELGSFGQQYPQARSARLGYLRWLAGKGRAAEARDEYLRMLKDFPNDDDIVFVVVQIAFLQGDHETAEPLIRRLLASEHRESDLLRVQLGQELETAGRLREAQAAYEAVPPGRDYAAARNALANLLARQGRLAEARGILQQAAVAQPERANAFLSAESSLLLKQNMPQQAYELLEAALAKNPDDVDLLYEAGMVAERVDRIDVMERHLRQLIKLKPDHAHAYNALGYTFADRNTRLDEAETLLLRALSLAGDDAAILDSVGWLYFRKGQMQQAVEYLQKSYARLPEPEVAAHLVEALWAAGRRDEARKVLDTARKTYPDSELLNKLAARIIQ